MSALKKLMANLVSLHPGTRFQVDWFVEQQVDENLAALLAAHATFRSGSDARLIKMKTSHCHDNSRALARKNGWAWAFGFALSPKDPCWRVHSWCLNKQGRIVETTLLRETYFGMPVCSAEIVGAANGDSLSDSTGNRRYWPSPKETK